MSPPCLHSIPRQIFCQGIHISFTLQKRRSTINPKYSFKLQIDTLYHLISFTFISPHDHEAFFVQIVRLYVKSVGFRPRIYTIIQLF